MFYSCCHPIRNEASAIARPGPALNGRFAPVEAQDAFPALARPDSWGFGPHRFNLFFDLVR
jgi:hypothetical protein